MEKENLGTFRIGPIRPPSEAASLLLQVTAGCTWNKCKFCELYKSSQFRAYTVSSIKEDIDVMAGYRDLLYEIIAEKGSADQNRLKKITATMTDNEYHCFAMVANWIISGGENVFLQDGNTIALKAERLCEVLDYLKKKFPTIKRITSYGRAETLSKVSAEQFKLLKAAGLDRIHSGFETGSDEVLKLIEKGTTSAQQIEAGKNIKAGGIELSVYFMPGIGGSRLTRENAMETARVVREIDPDYVRIRTGIIKEGTGLWEDYKRGDYRICSENEKVIEIKTIIENAQGCNGNLVSDHMINLLQEVEGNLKRDKEKMLGIINSYLSLSKEEQMEYQLARRSLMANSPSDMEFISSEELNKIRRSCKAVTDDYFWTEKMNQMLMSYI